MFFTLSKTLGIMLLPTNFLIGLGVAGSLLLFTRFATSGRSLVAASILLLAVCGFSPLGHWLLYPLEARFPAWNDARGTPDGVLVLGGAIEPELSAAHDTPVFTGAAARIFAAADLARRYPLARIVFSGGNANLIADDSAKEADSARRALEGLGIPPERLMFESRSRNTQENAEFSKVLIAPKQGERWLLVTSAFHMPRSMGIFRKAGFAVEPYPVNWRVGGSSDLLKFTNLSIDGLARVDIAVREWIGLAAYRVTGRTSAFFPSPDDK